MLILTVSLLDEGNHSSNRALSSLNMGVERVRKGKFKCYLSTLTACEAISFCNFTLAMTN